MEHTSATSGASYRKPGRKEYRLDDPMGLYQDVMPIKKFNGHETPITRFGKLVDWIDLLERD